MTEGKNVHTFTANKIAIVLVLCVSTLGFYVARSNGQQSHVSAPDSPEQKAQTLVDVPQDVLQGLLVHKVEPEYPSKAKAEHLEGPVVVAVVIGQDGSVVAAKAACGDDRLGKSAVSAVKQWKYKAPVLHGQPVEIRSMTIVDFLLPSTAATGQILKVDSQTAASHLQSSSPPEYPPDARIARIQGCVMLKAQIDENGNVKDVKLVMGHPMLAPAAQKAVKLWRYKPFVQNGIAVEADTYVVVYFIP